MKEKQTYKRLIEVLVFILAVIWWIPLLWMFIMSIKPTQIDAVAFSKLLVPPFVLDNFKYILNNSQATFGLWMANSLIVSSLYMIGGLILSSFAAFAFSKIHFVGKKFWFWLIMASLMIPGEAILIPLYIQMRSLNLLNTYPALIFPALTQPLGIMILKQFFDNLPGELFEAAEIDGCGWFKMMTTIALPLSKPALATIGIFTFLHSWNDFLWPYISITDPKLMTIPVGLPFFSSQVQSTGNISYVMAACAMAALPVLVVFFCLQKYIIAGISFSGLKSQ